MEKEPEPLGGRLKRLILGRERSPTEPGVFRRVSLVALFAWVGLGSDGISSSCYGPQEAFLALQGHHYLALILACMTAATVFIIGASYRQIIELFPTGGGAYLVASKLLSPKVGMVAGCALVFDYALTITVSVVSGADALFSLLPSGLHDYKLATAFVVLALLTLLNLRGVKESVVPIVPVFFLFLVTHGFAILYTLAFHGSHLPIVFSETGSDLKTAVSELGTLGVLFLLLHAYSLGGGTYTGIEAVSNGLPILREPRVETGKRTMTYMTISLAAVASGLILGYLLYGVEAQPGKTLNAVFFQAVVGKARGGASFVFAALFSEAMILLVAAQTGFLDGPRVLANMALDRWMPVRFSLLSDHLVAQNGILLMAGGSFALLWLSGGSIGFLVVLYSINVFLVFSLSQLGMVKHWWDVRRKTSEWFHKILINALGLLLTGFILVTVIIVKFHEGGWLTLVVTSFLVVAAWMVRRHYDRIGRLLQRLEGLLSTDLTQPARRKSVSAAVEASQPTRRSAGNTAVILVGEYHGVGLHTLFSVLRLFPGVFSNFVFIQIGVIDAGRFKGVVELNNLRESVVRDLARYTEVMKSHGFRTEAHYALGTDAADEAEKLALEVSESWPNVVFFSGQIVFPKDTMTTRLLHNYTAFTIQRRLYHKGLPMLILPVLVDRRG